MQIITHYDLYRRDNGEKLTQEQLLAEAKETELLNLQSLEKYHQLELEKKKTRIVKKAPTGPTIRYLSTSMPLIEELNPETERINVEEDEIKEESPPVETMAVATTDNKQCCERTFITFSTDSLMEANFSRKRVNPPQKNVCPITRSVFLSGAKYKETSFIYHISLQAKSQIFWSGDSATLLHRSGLPDSTRGLLPAARGERRRQRCRDRPLDWMATKVPPSPTRRSGCRSRPTGQRTGNHADPDTPADARSSSQQTFQLKKQNNWSLTKIAISIAIAETWIIKTFLKEFDRLKVHSKFSRERERFLLI